MLMGFKLSEQIFEDPGLEPVVGVGIPYGRSVSYDTNESIIEIRRRYDDKFCF